MDTLFDLNPSPLSERTPVERGRIFIKPDLPYRNQAEADRHAVEELRLIDFVCLAGGIGNRHSLAVWEHGFCDIFDPRHACQFCSEPECFCHQCETTGKAAAADHPGWETIKGWRRRADQQGAVL